MWCGDPLFETRLREMLCDPIEHTDRFDPEWMPVRRLIAVIGNREAQKATVVRQFCQEHFLTSTIVNIRYGFTGSSIQEIKNTLEKKGDSLSVLILDHLDVLAVEPDDVETQRFALELEQLATQNLIFIVGCFDRILKNSVDTYVKHFWRPWAASVLYLAPPHSTWIAAWLQTQLESYLKQRPRSGIRLKITEGEYAVLAQHCLGSSYGHLRDWIQTILYYAYQHLDAPITKDLLMQTPFMYGGNRSLHILPVDVLRDESNFSIAIGTGPTAVEPAPHNNIQRMQIEKEEEEPKKSKKKRAKLVEEDEEEEEEEAELVLKKD